MKYKDALILHTIIGGVLQSENVVGFSPLLLEKLENYFNELQMDYEDVGSTKIFLLSQCGEEMEDGRILLNDKKSKQKFDENYGYFMELDVDHEQIYLTEGEWEEFSTVSGLTQEFLNGCKGLLMEQTEEAPKEERKLDILLNEDRKTKKPRSKKSN